MPPIGSFFKVKIGNFSEIDFQEVSGLSMTLETAALKEGGQNRFVHQLPVRTASDKLLLKRALSPSSEVADWCKKALEEFSFSPQDIQISLLDFAAQDNILVQWHITRAYPVKWSVAGFDAMKNDVVIESIELQYHYFTKAFPV